MQLNRATLVCGFACLNLNGVAVAQAALPTSPPVTKDDVLEMSPFTVNTSRDVGYQAENTLAGSRLNTALRDTAASISVFTKEFLDDLAITDVRELVLYSVNTEMNTNANTNALAQNAIVGAMFLTPPILVRGIAASPGVDYFTSITPTDPYRVGRYEDSRGPNSILFGIGAPGGLLNESSKIATTARDSASLRYGFGSGGRQRLELDANKVLRKDRLAMSLAAPSKKVDMGWSGRRRGTNLTTDDDN